jgi:hypothetical protein
MKKNRTVWRLLAKALGEKASKCDKEADKVALIRLLMFLSIFITNCFIIANAIRHWNDETKIEVFVETSTIPEYETPSPFQKVNRTFEFE